MSISAVTGFSSRSAVSGNTQQNQLAFKRSEPHKNRQDAIDTFLNWAECEYGTKDQDAHEVGFYQEGYGNNAIYHVVDGADLEAAKDKKQPHLHVMRQFFDVGKSMQEIYGKQGQ